jgi:toxin-antitoxin system PIN domain toxin
MPEYLLDTNVLIALMWPAHADHQKVQQWFHRSADGGWATCPLTQAGFVRIICNPAFSSDAVSPRDAVNILEATMKHPHHHFWAGEVTLAKAVRPFLTRMNGHKQVTDAYLLGLALHNKGRLVSLDRGVSDLLPAKGADRDLLFLL